MTPNGSRGFRPTSLQFSRSWIPALLVVGATFCVFLSALQNGFVNWDDDANFLLNPHYRGLGLSQLRWAFTTFHLGPYQPLSWMSYGLDYLLWGMNPRGYHLTNLILHALNAGVFYWLARRLLALVFPAAEETSISLSAAIAALLFSIHPLRVESVAWITERRDVLSGLFYLLAIVWYVDASGKGRAGGPLRALSLTAYFLSLLSKGIGVSLPVVLTVLDVYPLRRLSGDVRDWPSRRDIWLEKIPYWALALVAAGAGFAGQSEAQAMGSVRGLALPLAHAFFGLAFYLWKTLLPSPIIPLYQMPAVLNLLDWPFLLSGAAVAAISALLVIYRRRYPALLAAWASYTATLLPVLGIVQLGPQMVADRYTYLACMAWPLLIAGGLLRLQARSPTLGRYFKAGLFAAIGALGWRSSLQTRIWRDSESLWRHTLGVDPYSSIAHHNLAMALLDQGKTEEALELCRKALELDPGHFKARRNLGVLLAQKGRFEEALVELQVALRARPRDADTYNDLGIVLRRLGRMEDALSHYRKALEIDSSNAQAHYNFANALAGRADFREAAEHYRRALEIDPGYQRARKALLRVDHP